MAADPDNLDFKVAASTHEDLLGIADIEKQLRKNLLQMVCTPIYLYLIKIIEGVAQLQTG
jgi:hypothetical protein